MPARIAKFIVVAAIVPSVIAGTAMAAPPYQLPKAPGQYCKGVPKKKLAGHKKTQFAECVTNMAKLNKNNKLSAKTICKGLSKKKPKGKGKTPYAACVSGVAKAKKDLA